MGRGPSRRRPRLDPALAAGAMKGSELDETVFFRAIQDLDVLAARPAPTTDGVGVASRMSAALGPEVC